MPVKQWDWLFAIGIIFSALDAYMIGANDVANSFATSVSSKSLSLKQACLAAAVMEFLGAVLVGARVTATIKDGIVSEAVFKGNPGVQLLAFVCAITASSCWLTFATRMSWPVSTTYSIVSSILGVGIAAGGFNAPNWGWNGGKGLATIFAGFGIAPSIAAGFSIILYSMVKFGVLVREDPTRWALYTSPLVFFLVGAVSTMSIIFKGSPSLGLDELPGGVMAGAIIGTAAVITLLSIIFWVPFVHAKVVKKDYTICWYHFFMGPLLWKRVPPADATSNDHITDYRIRAENDIDVNTKATASDSEKGKDDSTNETTEAPVNPSPLAQEVEAHPIEGAWILPKNLWILARYRAWPFIFKLATHGANVDIHKLQSDTENGASAKRIAEAHALATQYPNDTEHLYSFLQVLTACVASFAHGANDVSNAIGPFSVIYHVWSTGELSGKETPVPVWTLAFGAGMLVIGLATYGYKIMAVLGNRITLMSPSRGFSMELSASITVILAAQLGIPVSTTMCIVGSTIGVSLCNGDIRATNWRAIGWIFMGWVMTVPIAATLSGCLMGILLNAPHF